MASCDAIEKFTKANKYGDKKRIYWIITEIRNGEEILTTSKWFNDNSNKTVFRNYAELQAYLDSNPEETANTI